MFGVEGGGGGEQEQHRGLIPRDMEYLFDNVKARRATKEVAIVVSFLEIYCDQIRDLGKVGMEVSCIWWRRRRRRKTISSRCSDDGGDRKSWSGW